MFRGDRLADIRRYEDLSQKELAAILHVVPNTISAYENGAKKPSTDKMVEIAKYFHVSLDYLLGLIDERIPYDRKDAIVLPRGFPARFIPKVREYINLLMNQK